MLLFLTIPKFIAVFSPLLLSLLYIDSISSKNYILPAHGNVTSISKTFAILGFYLIIAYILALFIISHTQTIYCSDGDGEKFTNYQVNDNIQRNRPASPTFTLSSDSPYPYA
jgi:hypothetical protein